MTCRLRTPILLLFLALASLSACRGAATDDVVVTATPHALSQQDAPKVVLFVIDGPRYSETFGDTTHTYIPHLWNDLRPLGTLLTNFRNEGTTTTNPGHASIVTGTWQTVANDGSERPDKPTIFEYYRKDTGAPQPDTYVIPGKDKLNVCAYSTHAAYGAAYGATASLGHATDVSVYDALVSVLANQKPRVVLVSLSDVDEAGHSSVWSSYVSAITGADSLVWKTWNYLQQDPFYADQTYLFITNDHGRHDDAHGGFQNHGDACEGCRHLTFLVLGPDVKADHTSDSHFTQRDICLTVAQILDIPAPYAEGIIMQEIFESPPTGIKTTAPR